MTTQLNSPTFNSTLSTSQKYWGYDNFRGIQEDIINSMAKAKTPWG